MQIREKKDAEAQTKHNFILYVKQLHISAMSNHHQAEQRTINKKKL